MPIGEREHVFTNGNMKDVRLALASKRGWSGIIKNEDFIKKDTVNDAHSFRVLKKKYNMEIRQGAAPEIPSDKQINPKVI